MSIPETQATTAVLTDQMLAREQLARDLAKIDALIAIITSDTPFSSQTQRIQHDYLCVMADLLEKVIIQNERALNELSQLSKT